MKQNQIESNQTQIDLSEFPKGDIQQWRVEVEKLLKGADFEKKMFSKTYDGINIKPIYTSMDIENLPITDSLPYEYPFHRGWSTGYTSNRLWKIVKKFQSFHSLEKDQQQNLFSEQGYSAFEIPIEPSLIQVDELSRLFESNPEVSFYLNVHHSPIHLIHKLFEKNNFLNQQERVSIVYDPVTDLISQGNMVKSEDEFAKHINQLFNEPQNHSLACLRINGAFYHNAGATITQEIAIVLAIAVEYLRFIEQSDLSLQSAIKKFHVSFGMGSQFFLEIAKLRAFRLLWSYIANTLDPSIKTNHPHIHTETSQTNLTTYDPYVNLLRSTTETLSAILGGADSIWVAPFDHGYQLPNEFSERIAKNIPLIISKEAHLEEVIDPAGGSYAVEVLTNETAQKSYEIFQMIESEGGFVSFTKRNLLQEMIKKTVSSKTKDTATRKNIFIGTNLFVNGLEQEPKQRLLRNSEINSTLETVDCESLQPFYEVHEFEKLRTSVLNQKLNGTKVTCLILTIGNTLKFIPRIDFTTSFIETGGFEVKVIHVQNQLEEIQQKIEQEYEKTIILCSTDEWYEQNIVDISNRIKIKFRDTFLLLAGLPSDTSIQESFQKAGIDGFIHLRANVVETLKLIALQFGVSNE